ncbi:HipA family kinase [Flavobacterium sp.]|uniref:HipA family kinase n=1 Tax=Flavobacterium sp. TaxID=239 RepID=UPI002600D101|nr:HipA family kinase [Flavobacterium sp.]
MKILEATRFEGSAFGGSTMPWKMYLLDDGIEVPYIVKFFSEKSTLQQFPVFKEVISCELASQLDIITPNYALADLGRDFIDIAIGDAERAFLKTKHNGLKFASCYQERMMQYSHSKNIISPYNSAKVFAFDCLLFNLDRGQRKPNILIDDDGYMAIDHEQALPFIDTTRNLYDLIIERFTNRNIQYVYTSHLFFSYLKGLQTHKKKDLFIEFQQDLEKLNIDKITAIINELSINDISCDHSYRLIEYLRFAKKEAKLICEIILSVIN